MPRYARACRRLQPCPTQRLCEKTWHACSVATQTNLIPPDADLVHHIYHWKCLECGAGWTLHKDGSWYRD